MDSVEFGKYLSLLRKRAKLSMGKLAKISNVSQPYISQIERGDRGIPSPDILKKLAEALNVPYLELMQKAGFLPPELQEDIERRDKLKTTAAEYEDSITHQEQASKSLEEANDELKAAEDEYKFLIEYSENPTLELMEFLEIPYITYKGKPLAVTSRKKIIGILEYLLSEEEGGKI